MSQNTSDAPAGESVADTQAEARRRGARLFSGGVAATALLLVYYGYTSRLTEPLLIYLGLIMLALAILPSLLWARRGGSGLPTFEVLLLVTANVYSLPLLTGHVQLRMYAREEITTAALAVVAYQLAAILAYELIKGRPVRSPAFRTEVLTRDLAKYVGYGLILSTAYSVISVFYAELIPGDLNSMLRAVTFGIGMVSTFAQARRWGQGNLKRYERGFLAAMISIQVVAQFATLYLVGGMSIIVLTLVGYVSGSRRLPVLATLAFVSAAALLHNGKSTMRDKYWGENETRATLAVTDLPAFFGEWIQAGLAFTPQDEEQAMAKKLLERSSVFHVVCLVVANSPDPLPFLDGKTYSYVPGQLVPRFFWPNKPHAHIATDVLCIYYGLQDSESVRNATIGFGMVAEAYANFGFAGVVGLGLILGAFYKRIHTATSESPLLSYPGIFLILLTAWSFQTEATMAIWLSSLFQACVAVLGIPFLLRNLLGA